MDGAPSSPTSNPTITTDTDGGNEKGVGGLWWELIHVAPTLIEVGNIVTATLVDLDVFNAFRTTSKSWDDVDIFADGVTLDNPTLPVTLDPLENVGMTVTIDPEGAASVDGTIVFTFGSTVITVIIRFQRLAVFPFIPETGVIEELEWRTRGKPAKIGTERRQATRRRPRQFITMDVEVEDGPERARVENFLHANTGKQVGLPIWFEQNRLSQDVSATDTTINLYSALFADYRDGGTAVIWASETDLEAVNVDSTTATTLELSSGTVGAFPADLTIVAPMRIAWLRRSAKSTREQEGLTTYRLLFQVTDNDVEIADTSAFNTYDGKVLFDGFNKIEQASEAWERVVEVIDGETGLVQFQQLEPNARRVSQKGFVTESPQELWELRQVLHALRGKQVSFYLPSKSEEFTPVAPLSVATADLDFVHVGYKENVDVAPGRRDLRVVEVDGTTHDRRILTATEVSPTVESVTVDSNWPSTIPVADVDRIEVLEKVRWDADRFRIRHGEIAGDARMSAPTKSVLE
jgi:hypothetical protein